jgi:hypothetical protein
MISTVTTTTTDISVYFLLFVVLIGFAYHLIRNKEYKDTLLASVIIGLIFGLILVPVDDLLLYFLTYGKFIALVILGGFLAVGFKKLIKNSAIERSSETPGTPSKGYKKWWDKQNPRVQAITICIASLLGIALVISAVYLLTPLENPVLLGLEFTPSNGFINVNYTDEGDMIVFVANNTTQYVLEGSSEANATLKITSNDLGIYDQNIPLDAENRFTYKLDLPENFSSIEVTLNATKSGKDDRNITFFIKSNDIKIII